jgi:hypothetical protein
MSIKKAKKDSLVIQQRRTFSPKTEIKDFNLKNQPVRLSIQPSHPKLGQPASFPQQLNSNLSNINQASFVSQQQQVQSH